MFTLGGKKGREKKYLVNKTKISNSFKSIFQNSLPLSMQVSAGEEFLHVMYNKEVKQEF